MADVRDLLPCSYVYAGGKLVTVPASRAAVFRDRTLEPMDKRLLTRFLMQLSNTLHDNPFPQVYALLWLSPHIPIRHVSDPACCCVTVRASSASLICNQGQIRKDDCMLGRLLYLGRFGTTNKTHTNRLICSVHFLCRQLLASL